MPHVTANGIQLYFERGGAGADAPTLLFISGSGGDLRNRPNQFDSPLAQHFDMICYDQRGLGRTDNPEGVFSMAQYADDAAALMDALGIDRALVMGVSFGGMVAQEFALRHGQRIVKLVLACTSSGGAGGASYPLHELVDLPAEERAVAHLKVADLRHTDAWISAHPDQWARRVAQSVAAQPRADVRDGAAKQLAARWSHNTYARLPELDMPVLLAGGEFDGIAPRENMTAMHEQLQHSELRFYVGGHMFLIQDKTAYPDIIAWLTA